MTKKLSWRQQAVDWLSQPIVFRLIVGLFILQAAWIALTANYPMAFDEEYHLGIIRLFADHISPFWASQPAGADAYGAVARDPSYIYHYLMSFPYRLITLLSDNFMTQILALRLLQIALFASGLAIYRRLLLKTGASVALVHSCLLVFVLIPVVPLLAAQINYDSLFIPAVGLILLLAINFDDSLRSRKALNIKLLLGIVALGLLASLIKYAFLPILATIMCYLAVRLWRVHKTLGVVCRCFTVGVRAISRRSQVILVLGLLLAASLFVERYGLNLIRYHAPVANCSQVLSVEQCSNYGPWLRDYTLELQKTSNGDGPHAYMWSWLQGMWLRLFFAVDGPNTHFQTRGPLVVPAMSAVAFAVAGVVLIARYGRQVLARYNQQALILLAIVSSVYVTILWLDGYEAYQRTGKAVAINGRYLLPVLPILFVIVGLAFSVALRRWPRCKLAVAAVAIICLLWGGGALTYVLRSNDAWYWPNTPLYRANHALQRTIGPLTPGYDNPVQYLP